jgi:uncharacterized protein (DUF1778 family)
MPDMERRGLIMLKTEKKPARRLTAAAAKAKGFKRRAAPEAKEATSRLEARIPTHLYETLERAATLRGLTLTGYITATMGEDARRTIEQTEIIRLSRADQIAFAEALISPPEPNAKLRAAMRRHAELIGK